MIFTRFENNVGIVEIIHICGKYLTNVSLTVFISKYKLEYTSKKIETSAQLFV